MSKKINVIGLNFDMKLKFINVRNFYTSWSINFKNEWICPFNPIMLENFYMSNVFPN